MTDKPGMQFEDIVDALKEAIGEDVTKEMLHAWHAGEPEIVLNWLIGVVTDIKPAMPDEVYRALMNMAQEEDDFQKHKWQKTKQEMTPEQIKHYNLRPPRADSAERLKRAFPDRES